MKSIKLIDYHWRLRDELAKRRNHTKKYCDDISKMDIDLVEILEALLTEYRLKTEGNADT